MKAVVIDGPGQVSLKELTKPVPGPEDALIRARAIGICGSDLELYQGTRPTGYYHYPVIPGHEWAGEIVELGAHVQTLAVGDKVVVEGFLNCGFCENCRTGLTNLCEAGYDEIGFTRPGGLAEYVVVPARLIHQLPSIASFEEAALLEPTAVVAHAFLRAQPHAGATIAVIGDGAIGLLAVQLARLFSPQHLVLIGGRQERLELGQRLGATHLVNAKVEDPLRFVQQLTGGRGADLVIEGGNRPSGVLQAFEMARRGGTVVLEGIAGGGAPLQVESDLFVLKHLAVYGIFGASSAAWTYATNLFCAGLLNLGALVSHRFKIGDFQVALDTLLGRQPGTLKVLLVHD
jgi:2-desacetyl-2-hydroxyethyl bacteriochlorophyllide A dehydrogenase